MVVEESEKSDSSKNNPFFVDPGSAISEVTIHGGRKKQTHGETDFSGLAKPFMAPSI